MFTTAILIGIYSYLIFSMGVLGALSSNWITLVSSIFFIVFFIFLKPRFSKTEIKFSRISKFIFMLIVIQAFINLIGALGPELGFDALWYHLTLPKIFLENHKLIHIPGGLLYYSEMPKLTEMIYASSISIFNEIAAKVVHFSFGVLILVAIYRFSRKFMDQKFSFLAVLIFYSNLVVGWQSTTAYIDLSRSFFEVMALLGFINWIEASKASVKRGWLMESAVMLGLAISTKLLSLGSLFIFLFLIVYFYKKINKESASRIFLYASIVIYVASPWFLLSFLNTGNPVYPLFSKYITEGLYININPIAMVERIWNLFTHSNDPVSPIYLIFLPFIIFYFRKFNLYIKIITLYFFSSLIIWNFIPEDESRYVFPYLPALSMVISYTIYKFFNDKFMKNLSIAVVISISIISIVYRGVANSKYVPVILGTESKIQFLSTHLNFNYGDFYDTDGFFKKHIKRDDKVLLYGFHNLYYVDFPFIDSSYIKRGDRFNYIATQNLDLPSRFKFWREIYSNLETGVKLYSLGGQEWIY